MITRITSAAVTGTLLFSLAVPAFAKTTDEIIAEQKSFKANELCEGKEGTNRGRCIGDVIKRINILKDEFKDALEEERTAWYLEHSNLGVSTEYRTALNAFLASTKTKRSTFTSQQREIEKLFFALQKEIRKTSSEITPQKEHFTRRLTTMDLETATKKCENQSKRKDLRAVRLCVRQQLRDPAARQMGAAQRSQRSQ